MVVEWVNAILYTIRSPQHNMSCMILRYQLFPISGMTMCLKDLDPKDMELTMVRNASKTYVVFENSRTHKKVWEH
jgi:hypothetical protein